MPSSESTLVRLGETVAGPWRVHVDSQLKRDTFIDLYVCALYAYLGGDR